MQIVFSSVSNVTEISTSIVLWTGWWWIIFSYSIPGRALLLVQFHFNSWIGIVQHDISQSLSENNNTKKNPIKLMSSMKTKSHFTMLSARCGGIVRTHRRENSYSSYTNFLICQKTLSYHAETGPYPPMPIQKYLAHSRAVGDAEHIQNEEDRRCGIWRSEHCLIVVTTQRVVPAELSW